LLWTLCGHDTEEHVKEDTEVGALLVGLVSALVSTLADQFEESGAGVLELEAYLYRMLAVNCKEKAEMAEAAAKSFRTAQ
jgi:hypothetical protein